ncbi:ice-binding family protein [uncultured Sphaerotilus sp.]|uniref:ice-binding family protein n=1 Tax=uncultured Sphaerotilus sp. TaxID=474984 RepID=UPI0030CA419B
MHTPLIRHFKLVPKAIALAAVIALTAMPAHAAPELGSAQSFAVLAGTTVTDAHSAPNLPTQIFGDLGTSPGASITGLFSGVNVNGGTVHANDAVAQLALTDATTAYNALAAQAFDSNLTGQVMGSPGLTTLTPGVYHFNTSAQLTGTLVLDFQGDPNRDFIFQIGSTLTTASDSFISVLNAGAGSGIYWQIGSSATLGTGTDFAGNLLALTSVTLNDGAQIICGRAIGLNGAVTLVDNAISNDCGMQNFGTGLVDAGSLGFSGGPLAPVTPVPEPATAMLFLAGLAGLGATRLKAWQRKR